MENIKIFYLKDLESFSDYELIDTGEGEKLERFGTHKFVRPFEGAVWPKTLSKKEWSDVDGKFWSSKMGAKAGWKMERKFADKWPMEYKGIKYVASPTPFRHLSFFPEQAPHWDFIEEKISQVSCLEEEKNSSTFLHPTGGTFRQQNSSSVSRPKFLNLFGYTGVASLFALRAGAEVTHVDASKQSLKIAKENQDLSGLADLPMRIIEDDVLKFLDREIKRGNKYDAIIMDPPKFGRGPKGEIWKLEEKLPELLEKVKKVLSEKPIFVILTSYAVDSSAITLAGALESVMKPARNEFHSGGDFNGEIIAGELCVLEKTNKRFISLANTAVWASK